MATPDIRNKLITQSKQKIAVAKAPARQDFMPEIPSANIDTALPPAVLNSLQSSLTAGQTSISNERRRLDETAEAVKVANAEIDSATKQIQAADSDLFLDFQGIFDPQYNRAFQRSRIDDAKRKLNITANELDLERQRETLDLKEAGLPVELYKQQINLQTQKSQLSTAQANAVVSSNAARKNMRKMMQMQYSDDEIMQMYKTKTSDTVWTSQEIDQYVLDKENAALDMEGSRLSNESNRLDLTEKFEVRALNKLPLGWLRSAMNLAETSKLTSI